ncbi:rCG21028 [Rattus norvegicus]|uniref:RCG21028 n=1 Tax=Rattus norvegicus TaxID=10116 RepID=A6JE60_RAT|nr:rCG21028 [Rattus norvegicus]
MNFMQVGNVTFVHYRKGNSDIQRNIHRVPKDMRTGNQNHALGFINSNTKCMSTTNGVFKVCQVVFNTDNKT